MENIVNKNIKLFRVKIYINLFFVIKDLVNIVIFLILFFVNNVKYFSKLVKIKN